jgi:hypothetical protein
MILIIFIPARLSHLRRQFEVSYLEEGASVLLNGIGKLMGVNVAQTRRNMQDATCNMQHAAMPRLWHSRSIIILHSPHPERTP